jgi:hypothetical protein
MIQTLHTLPILNVKILAPGAAWDTIASLNPADATEEITNDFVWFLTDH